jgi:hypothetical protein
MNRTAAQLKSTAAGPQDSRLTATTCWQQREKA